MVFFEETALYEKKKFFDLPILLAIIIIGGFLGYYMGQKVWRVYPQLFKELPAQVSSPLTGEKITEIVQGPAASAIGNESQAQVYTETAQPGDGITNLARKALKTYLQDNNQSFTVTVEHKVYIEDYVAKKLGSGQLQLGAQLQISLQLLQEALDQSQNLTSSQLQNLTQFSQLVSGLNY